MSVIFDGSGGSDSQIVGAMEIDCRSHSSGDDGNCCSLLWLPSWLPCYFIVLCLVNMKGVVYYSTFVCLFSCKSFIGIDLVMHIFLLHYYMYNSKKD